MLLEANEGGDEMKRNSIDHVQTLQDPQTAGATQDSNAGDNIDYRDSITAHHLEEDGLARCRIMARVLVEAALRAARSQRDNKAG